MTFVAYWSYNVTYYDYCCRRSTCARRRHRPRRQAREGRHRPPSTNEPYSAIARRATLFSKSRPRDRIVGAAYTITSSCPPYYVRCTRHALSPGARYMRAYILLRCLCTRYRNRRRIARRRTFTIIRSVDRIFFHRSRSDRNPAKKDSYSQSRHVGVEKVVRIGLVAE